MPERPPEPSPEAALNELLLSLYAGNIDGLTRFLLFDEQWSSIVAHLPTGNATAAMIVGQAVIELKRRGLVDGVLFTRLEHAFPRRDAGIRAVRARWKIEGVEPNPRPPSRAEAMASDSYFQMKLQGAERRKRELEAARRKTDEVDKEIVELKRQLRQGHRLGQGDVLGGRYLLSEQVGRGGFGTVWKARDQADENDVAIKILHTDAAQDRSKLERFIRGARTMKRLDHRAVVRIHEPVRSDGEYHFFVMEFVRGSNLERAILERKFPMSQIVPLLIEVGGALTQAHELGMVHRDIKPANILIDESNKPRLTDFDLVRAADTTGGTREGSMGTVFYAAPEMFENAETADGRADVFSLAMTAVFAYLGRQLPRDVLRGPDKVIARLACQASIKKVLLRAVEEDAQARYPTMAAFCDALTEATAPARRPIRDALRKLPWRKIVGAAIVGLVLLFLFSMLPRLSCEDPVAPPAVSTEPPPVPLPATTSDDRGGSLTAPLPPGPTTEPPPATTGKDGGDSPTAPLPLDPTTQPKPDPTTELPKPDPLPDPTETDSTEADSTADSTSGTPPSDPGLPSLGPGDVTTIASRCQPPGCYETAIVILSLDKNGVITGARPQGTHETSPFGRCIKRRLLNKYAVPNQQKRFVFSCK